MYIHSLVTANTLYIRNQISSCWATSSSGVAVIVSVPGGLYLGCIGDYLKRTASVLRLDILGCYEAIIKVLCLYYM